MNRILVTGGAGFIGSNFIHMLLHDAGQATACCPDMATYPKDANPGVQVLNVDRMTYAGRPENLAGIDKDPRYSFLKADICDPKAMKKAFTTFRPEAVVHFAAESHVDRSIEAGLEFARTNVLGTQVLLDAARNANVQRFIHIGTDEVYGSIAKGSSKEGDMLDPSSPYSASKAGSDLLALAHHRTYGLPVSVTRCTNNYGPRQHPEKLIPLMITKARRDEPLPVYGDGKNVRDWIYVKDHAAALLFLLEQAKPGEVYHVGGRDERRNLDTVKTVLRALNKPESLITFVKDRPGHDLRYSLNDHKLRKMGWKPRMGFEEGLKHTIDWLKRQSRGKQ